MSSEAIEVIKKDGEKLSKKEERNDPLLKDKISWVRGEIEKRGWIEKK